MPAGDWKVVGEEAALVPAAEAQKQLVPDGWAWQGWGRSPAPLARGCPSGLALAMPPVSGWR